MKHMVLIGQYYPVDSFFHRADPRAKIITLFLYFFALFLVNDLYAKLAVTVLLLAGVLFAKIPLRMLLKSLKPVLFFVVLTAVLNAFMIPGEVVWQWGFLKITDAGIYQGIWMAWRLILLMISASLLTLTTTPIAFTDGLESLLKPLNMVKVPVHELAMMISIALRFIPTLMEEGERIIQAQMARGMDFHKGSLKERIKNILPLLVPFFLSAMKRADELAEAMESRGYHGGRGRTRMRVLMFTVSDMLLVALMTVLLVGLLIYRWVL